MTEEKQAPRPAKKSDSAVKTKPRTEPPVMEPRAEQPTHGVPNGEPLTTGVPGSSGPVSRPPDPEVSERPERRRFTAEYKLRIVQEADRCKDTNGIGSLLRREGLYSSHLSTWR